MVAVFRNSESVDRGVLVRSMRTVYALPPLVLIALASCLHAPRRPAEPSSYADYPDSDVTDRETSLPLHVVPGQRPVPGISIGACTGSDGSWRCKAPRPLVFGAAGRTPILPASWSVPAWYIDPASITTCASDSNTCTSATCGAGGVGPCLTWHEINDGRWGCQGSPTACPRLQQNATVTYLDGVTDALDIVYANPAFEGAGAWLNFRCALPTALAIGTLASVTAKNRSTPHNLTANLPGSGLAAGQFIVNTTHPSRAFIQATGTPATITQPLAACTVPLSAENPPAEVDTWANGDSVSIYQLANVAFGGLNGANSGIGTALNGGTIYVTNCNDWSDNVSAQTNMNGNLQVQESTWNRQSVMVAGGAFIEQIFTNVYAGSRLTAYTGNPGNPVVLAAGYYNVVTGGAYGLDGDVMINFGIFTAPSGYSQLGLVNVLSGGQAQFLQGPVEAIFIDYASPQIWGAGALLLNGTTRFSYPGGAGQAASVFKQTGGFQLNNSSSCALSTQAGAITPTKTLTAAHLDTDLGAVTGCYVTPGGASVCNGGF
jgi:hypothetical protein